MVYWIVLMKIVSGISSRGPKCWWPLVWFEGDAAVSLGTLIDILGQLKDSSKEDDGHDSREWERFV